MRRVELEGAEKKQTTHSKAIPKAFGFEAATRSNSPSLRDEAATAMLADKHDDLKKQNQYDRSAFGVQSTARIILKKQSQFATDDIVATALEQIDYGDNPAGGGDENKANQACHFSKFRAVSEHVVRSQFPTLERIIGVEKGEKPAVIAAG
jgi:hypothetical protein